MDMNIQKCINFTSDILMQREFVGFVIAACVACAWMMILDGVAMNAAYVIVRWSGRAI